MSIASNKTLLFIALALFILGSCLISPNATRKPLTTPDGALVHRPDGSVKTKLDIARYMKSNWLGFTLVFLSFAVLLFAVGRLALLGIFALATRSNRKSSNL